MLASQWITKADRVLSILTRWSFNTQKATCLLKVVVSFSKVRIISEDSDRYYRATLFSTSEVSIFQF